MIMPKATNSGLLSMSALAAVLTAVSLTGCAMQPSPCCAGYPVKSFKATYELTSANSPTIKQVWQSNGKGKIRLTNSESQGSTLIDFSKDTAIKLLPQSESALEGKLDTPWISHASEEQTEATDLGTKTVGGHPCHGWKLKTNGGDAEYWLGEDTGCYVEVTFNKPDKTTSTLKLVDYTKGSQDPALFEIPAGCKVAKQAQAIVTSGM